MPPDAKHLPAILEITPDLSIPKVFARVAQELGDKVAMREKELHLAPHHVA